MKLAKLGSVFSGSLKTEDMLNGLVSALEGMVSVNGYYFSKPENFPARDKFAALIGEAQDCFDEDRENVSDEKHDEAQYVIESLFDALQEFAPPYACFGAHEGDGADFGYWLLDMEEIKEQVGFASCRGQEFPEGGFTGEWLHINDRGNCTLYVRDASWNDVEIWGVA